MKFDLFFYDFLERNKTQTNNNTQTQSLWVYNLMWTAESILVRLFVTLKKVDSFKKKKGFTKKILVSEDNFSFMNK